ncbi:hypothetical protein L2E82_40627 [Cichorium intybus]|uniref:Uncharacterized protein n=1 Tax=Cichorium intybus TaxID=13427 RepID=A0ACB9ALW6_CICIN|nr:hypothetical protein L2E82_40627 [Cichorium intybus]
MALSSDTAGVTKLLLEDVKRKRQEASALYRMEKKCDIAMAALYLASDAVNGTTLVVDGGIWLSTPRHMSKEEVKRLSKLVEKRSSDAPVGVPNSKL